MQKMQNLAKQEDKSMSIVAKEFIQEAIDKHEDLALYELAMNRERKPREPLNTAWREIQ